MKLCNHICIYIHICCIIVKKLLLFFEIMTLGKKQKQCFLRKYECFVRKYDFVQEKLFFCFENMIFIRNYYYFQEKLLFASKYDFSIRGCRLFREDISFESTQGPVPTMEGTGPGPPGRFAREARGGLGPKISAPGPRAPRAC